MSKHASEGDFAELSLAVYVEELVAHKRVLFVGDPSSPAPERMASAARSVDVVSTRSRVRGTRRGGRVASRPWPGPDDTGRWDLVVIPDLGAAGLADEGKLAQAAAWLAPGGVFVAGTPDPDGPAATPSAIAYEELFDLLDGAFEHVRMLGQAPFAGFSMVDFAPASAQLEVTFDGSILEGAGERAERYYALSGARDVVLDAYAVVQVPSAAIAGVRPREDRPEGRASSELAERLREQQDALDAANVHAEEIERELEAARAEVEESRRELGAARERVDAAQREREGLESQLRSLEAQLAQPAREPSIDDEYAALEASLSERGRELTDLRLAVARRGTLVRDLVEELRETSLVPARGPERPEHSSEERSGARVPSAHASGAERRAGRLVEPGAEELGRVLHAQLDAAVARAVNAEAEKAKLAFQVDEVRGELAVAQRRCRDEVEELRRLEAALRGTVRGLNARLGEVIELHQLAQARTALAEDDRTASEERARRLATELAEARDQLELELARARVTETAREGSASRAPLDDARLREVELAAAEREGHLLGALVQCREQAAELQARQRQGKGEAERARVLLEELEQRVEGMRAGYELRVTELVRELDTVGSEAERALVQAGELLSRLEIKERAEASLRGEISGLALRLADREHAVAALQQARLRDEGAAEPREVASRVVVAGRAPAPVLEPAELHEALDQARQAHAAEQAARETAQAEVEGLRAEAHALRAEVERLASLQEARHATVEYARDTDDEARVAALSATVAARDALAARLQRELADASDRRVGLERGLEEHQATLAKLREDLAARRAVSEVSSQESLREVEDLTDRLEQCDRERREALSGLEEARGILAQLMSELPPRREGGGSSDLAALRQLRDRVSHLDAEAADREVLLRSLTAQLEERDDRIRALERLRDGAPGEEPPVLQQKLFEMEERLARLQEELEHERARRRSETSPS